MDALMAEGIRLDRHYAYRWCAPTRSALMTGRLPYHVFETTNHVSKEMTMLPAKLKQVGYKSHQIGKWHLGAVAPWMTPKSRGFDSSLGFLAGGEDHWTHFQKDAKNFGCTGVDLWRSYNGSDGPVHGKNGTYSSFLFGPEAVRVVEEHDLSANQSLFVYVALQTMHAPNQVPVAYSSLFPQPEYTIDYAIMNGMGATADDVLKNLTSALKRRGMWESTLLVYLSDNGGPAAQSSSGGHGNNWPLRGGKTNEFEGGIRVTAFVTGGFLPSHLRGTTRSGYIHAADWYSTFCGLAGIDAADTPSPNPSGVPPIDALDVWPYLSGQTDRSPRTRMMISSRNNFGDKAPKGGCLIDGAFKLLRGNQTYGFWQGPIFPNATTNRSTEHHFDCGAGCLFNIIADPTEQLDLATAMPAKLAAMQQLFANLSATRWQAEEWPLDQYKCDAYSKAHNGSLGPYY